MTRTNVNSKISEGVVSLFKTNLINNISFRIFPAIFGKVNSSFLHTLLSRDLHINPQDLLQIGASFSTSLQIKNNIIRVHEMRDDTLALNIVRSNSLMINGLIYEKIKNIGHTDIQVGDKGLF